MSANWDEEQEERRPSKPKKGIHKCPEAVYVQGKTQTSRAGLGCATQGSDNRYILKNGARIWKTSNTRVGVYSKPNKNGNPIEVFVQTDDLH